MNATDFTDTNGDRWVVRPCESDEPCVVIERWMHKVSADPQRLIDALVACGMSPYAATQAAAERSRDDESPTFEMHIPASSIHQLIHAIDAAIKHVGKEPTDAR